MLSELPTAEKIRKDSRLRPEQVSVSLANETALEAEIEPIIYAQAEIVEQRLMGAADPLLWPFGDEQISQAYPTYDESQRVETLARHSSLAKEAVRLLVLGDLFDSAGALNERYQAESENYFARAEKLLQMLSGSIEWIAGRNGTSNQSTGAQILTITVGESYSCDEYASC